MIQDIAPHVYDNTFEHRRAPRPDDYVFFQRNGREMLISEENGIFRFPTVREAGTEGLYYCFRIDDTAFFTGPDYGAAPKELPGFEYRNQAEFRTREPHHLAFAGITGMQLMRWLDSERYCGHCGTKTEESGTERAFVCPGCGRTVYPRLMPAVIVAVTNHGKLLVTSYANRPGRGYALIAGFTEIGETVEETVHREVLEEVGLKVKNLRYYKSQPWSFTDTVLMGYFCELDGDDDTIRMDRNELKEARWYTRDELPDRRGEAALTAEMMQLFRDNVKTEWFDE